MGRTFIAATDLSPRSDRALRRAFRLAAQQDARVIVLHVVDDAAPSDLATQIQNGSRQVLDRFVESIRNGVDAEIRVIPGDPASDVVNAIRSAGADLLIVGTHRSDRLLDSFYETTAQRIVRLSACPVLTVADRNDHDYASVIAATDFSPGAAAAILHAAEIAPEAIITPLHALHVPYRGMMSYTSPPADDIEQSFRLEAKEADAAWRAANALPGNCGPTEIMPGSPLSVLAEKVRSGRVDLIAAGAHGRVGQRRALLGSVASDLLRNPPCDVLVARPG